MSMVDDDVVPILKARLNATVIPRCISVGNFDGDSLSLACGVQGNKIILIHGELDRNGSELDSSQTRYFNTSKPITCIGTATNVLPTPSSSEWSKGTSDSMTAESLTKYDSLVVGTTGTIQNYDVNLNKDLFYVEQPDTVFSLTSSPSLLSSIPTGISESRNITDSYVIIGASQSLSVLDSQMNGKEVGWSVANGDVTTLCVADIDHDGEMEVMVGCSTGEITLLKGSRLDEYSHAQEDASITSICVLTGAQTHSRRLNQQYVSELSTFASLPLIDSTELKAKLKVRQQQELERLESMQRSEHDTLWAVGSATGSVSVWSSRQSTLKVSTMSSVAAAAVEPPRRLWTCRVAEELLEVRAVTLPHPLATVEGSTTSPFVYCVVLLGRVTTDTGLEEGLLEVRSARNGTLYYSERIGGRPAALAISPSLPFVSSEDMMGASITADRLHIQSELTSPGGSLLIIVANADGLLTARTCAAASRNIIPGKKVVSGALPITSASLITASEPALGTNNALSENKTALPSVDVPTQIIPPISTSEPPTLQFTTAPASIPYPSPSNVTIPDYEGLDPRVVALLTSHGPAELDSLLESLLREKKMLQAAIEEASVNSSDNLVPSPSKGKELQLGSETVKEKLKIPAGAFIQVSLLPNPRDRSLDILLAAADPQLNNQSSLSGRISATSSITNQADLSLVSCGFPETGGYDQDSVNSSVNGSVSVSVPLSPVSSTVSHAHANVTAIAPASARAAAPRARFSVSGGTAMVPQGLSPVFLDGMTVFPASKLIEPLLSPTLLTGSSRSGASPSGGLTAASAARFRTELAGEAQIRLLLAPGIPDSASANNTIQSITTTQEDENTEKNKLNESDLTRDVVIPAAPLDICIDAFVSPQKQDPISDANDTSYTPVSDIPLGACLVRMQTRLTLPRFFFLSPVYPHPVHLFPSSTPNYPSPSPAIMNRADEAAISYPMKGGYRLLIPPFTDDTGACAPEGTVSFTLPAGVTIGGIRVWLQNAFLIPDRLFQLSSSFDNNMGSTASAKEQAAGRTSGTMESDLVVEESAEEEQMVRKSMHGSIDVRFVDCRRGGRAAFGSDLRIAVQDTRKEIEMVIQARDLALAAAVLQDMASFFQLEVLDTHLDFPRDFELLRKSLDMLKETSALRGKVSAAVAETLSKVKTFLVRTEDARIRADFTSLRVLLSQLVVLNEELLREQRTQQNNHSLMVSSLKSINAMIFKAANARVGPSKTKVIQDCRNAIKNNNFAAIINIMKG